jgi:Replicase family/Primase C terminal 1 (PriCT-1)
MALSLHARVGSSRSDSRRVDFDVPIFARPDETPHTVAEAITQHHKVRQFRGGQDKNAAFPNRGKALREFAFVQINPRDFINFLVVDVDREDAELWLMHPAVPEPHWIIQNPQNGHAQAGWMIDPVRRAPDAREHPVRYAESVQAALDVLTGSDPNFTRFLVRNPVAQSPAGNVRFGSRLEPYTLGELMKHMQSYRDPFEPEFNAWSPTREAFNNSRTVSRRVDEGGRNNALFYATRTELWRRFTDQGISPSQEHALAYADGLNQQLATPLPEREVRELAFSAVRQVLRGKGKGRNGPPDPWLSEMGRKGGQAATESKKAAAAKNAAKATRSRQEKAQDNATQARALRSLGHSLAAIGRLIGKAVRTVQRYLSTDLGEDDITQATGSHDMSSDVTHPVITKAKDSSDGRPTVLLPRKCPYRKCAEVCPHCFWWDRYCRLEHSSDLADQLGPDSWLAHCQHADSHED